MVNQLIFNFKTDINSVEIPDELNNPFELSVSEIARIATKEFQDFIASEAKEWEHDFQNVKGKMFGVLVVKKAEGSYGFLGTSSGKLPGNDTCGKFVPSVFNDAVDDFFINKGMAALTEIGNQIKNSNDQAEISSLQVLRKIKSIDIQQQLFSHYKFLNRSGEVKNVLEIFEASSHGLPPAAAGECAAPKLLQYAFNHNLKPIALAEFWWGKSRNNNERDHLNFYPACKNKCRPILEFMLEDDTLFESSMNEMNL